MAKQVLDLGSAAPEVTLEGRRDEVVALSDQWAGAERGIVLGFLRHYG